MPSTRSIWTEVASPWGPVLLVGSDEALRQILLPIDGQRPSPNPDARHDPAAFPAARAQLAAWFDDGRAALDFPAEPIGTPFQQQVWALVRDIPRGETRSYGDLARALGRPGASRAVGAANGANPLPLLIPCHRVVGADGSLTGFAGGLPLKRALLAHERAHAAPPGPLFAARMPAWTTPARPSPTSP
jgi:methylated-DNA-[protein]-cysteine S-methyltransferase